MLSRLAYRIRQSWNTLPCSSRRVETETLLPHLSPLQIVLFRRMQPSEQRHAARMLEELEASGQNDPDLLTASLLHDVGKVLYPLSLPDRVIIVLCKKLFRQIPGHWSSGTPTGFCHPFVVAAHHPEWGAELAEQAGVSSRAVDLIRHHQDSYSTRDPILAALQAVDNQN